MMVESCIERLFQFAISIHREVPTTPEAVWKKLIDMESLPQTLSGVVSVELLNRGGNDEDEDMTAEVGKRYRVTRVSRRLMDREEDEQYFADWTIVALRSSDEESTYSKSVTFYTNDLVGASSSSTWSVRRGRDDKSCILTLSIALMPRRIFLMLTRVFCVCMLKKKAIELTSIDLEDFGNAACNCDEKRDENSP